MQYHLFFYICSFCIKGLFFFSYPYVKVKVTQSCLTLCNPKDYRIHRILQARILEWVAFPFSRGSSQPRDWTPGLPHCRRILYQLLLWSYLYHWFSVILLWCNSVKFECLSWLEFGNLFELVDLYFLIKFEKRKCTTITICCGLLSGIQTLCVLDYLMLTHIPLISYSFVYFLWVIQCGKFLLPCLQVQ